MTKAEVSWRRPTRKQKIGWMDDMIQALWTRDIIAEVEMDVNGGWLSNYDAGMPVKETHTRRACWGLLGEPFSNETLCVGMCVSVCLRSPHFWVICSFVCVCISTSIHQKKHTLTVLK